jgi:hypothetical protein
MGFLDFVYRKESKVTRKCNVSEIGSLSVLGEGKEIPTLLGPFRKSCSSD